MTEAADELEALRQVKARRCTETNVAGIEVFRVVEGKITEVRNCGYQQGAWN